MAAFALLWFWKKTDHHWFLITQREHESRIESGFGMRVRMRQDSCCVSRPEKEAGHGNVHGQCTFQQQITAVWAGPRPKGNEKVWSRGMPWSVHAKCNGIFVREIGQDSQDMWWNAQCSMLFASKLQRVCKVSSHPALDLSNPIQHTVQWLKLKLRPLGKVFWNKQNLSKSNQIASTTFNNYQQLRKESDIKIH